MSKECKRCKQLEDALLAWEAFWDDMPEGQLGKIVCDIGLLNDAFCKTTAVLRKERKDGKDKKN